MNTSLIGSDEDEGFLGSVAADTGMDPLAATVQDVKKSLRVDDIKIETGKTTEDLSLVIGTWLSPRLYVSYGKNLLKESGNFNTRYVLGHGFSMKTETGATQSGVDLMYEIDK
jgi:translocation and assembly module TamB